MEKEKNKERIPQLRFPEFKNAPAWEQRKLGEVAEITMGQSPNSANYTNNPSDHILVQGNADMRNGYVHPRVWTTQVTKTAKKGALIISVRAPVGDVGKTEYNVVLGRGVAAIQGNEFIFQLLSKMKINGYWEKLSTGSTFESINSNDLKDASISLPSLPEQTAIGDFFSTLDRSIALHQRELENLKNRKKSLLQKMFPKNGESVPKIRFPEFKNAPAWEQRKLGEVAERVRGNDGRMDLPTLTISAEKGWLDQRERFSANIAGKEQKNYTLLKQGELSYNHGNSKLAKYGVVFELQSYSEALVPKVYHSFRMINDSSATFIEYMFATKIPDRELGKLISSGARMDGLLNINYDEFMGIRILIPTLASEQKAIGDFFSTLDRSIALHQRKLEHLKLRKKALLQKMFP